MDTCRSRAAAISSLIIATLFHKCSVSSSNLAPGDNEDGYLGVGNNNSVDKPTEVAGGHAFTQVSAGHSFACALDDSQKAW